MGAPGRSGAYKARERTSGRDDPRLPEEDKDAWAGGRRWTQREVLSTDGCWEAQLELSGWARLQPALSRHGEEAEPRAGEEGKTA